MYYFLAEIVADRFLDGVSVEGYGPDGRQEHVGEIQEPSCAQILLATTLTPATALATSFAQPSVLSLTVLCLGPLLPYSEKSSSLCLLDPSPTFLPILLIRLLLKIEYVYLRGA